MDQSPKVIYRPPGFESDDDSYDGFYFGDESPARKGIRWTMPNESDTLYLALVEGNLELFKELQQQQEPKFNVDEYMDGGFTPLLHACQKGYVDIVEYVLKDLCASPNKHFDSSTPLMVACGTDGNKKKEPHVVEKLVKLLLKHGADINMADKYGVTAIMLACQHGYTNAVRLMITEESINKPDNMGCTPIFYAIENNHPEIVKILVEADAYTAIPNIKGYTPRQVAQIHGFYDLFEFLPEQEEPYCVPPNYLYYSKMSDVVPGIFLKPECPEYFQEINNILVALNLQKLVDYFAKEGISLKEFLCIDNERLKEIGLEAPFFHNKLQNGLLNFHLRRLRTLKVARVKKQESDNFYEILTIVANHLRDVIVLKGSLRYIKKNISKGKFGNVSEEQLQRYKNNLEKFRISLKKLQATAKYLSSFSPKQNALYINFDEIQKERKRRKIHRFFKFTVFVIGISAFICIKSNFF